MGNYMTCAINCNYSNSYIIICPRNMGVFRYKTVNTLHKGDNKYNNNNNNNSQQDATVCRYLFTLNLLYMFRVSIAPIIRSI